MVKVAAHANVSNLPYCDSLPDLYGFNRIDNQFYEIEITPGDPYTFAFTPIQNWGTPTGNGNSPNGLAYDDATGKLYFSETNPGDETVINSELRYIPGTVSVPTLDGVAYGATFADGKYWYVVNYDDDLVSVDPDTGTITTEWPDLTDNSRQLRFGDLVYNTDDRTFYGSAIDANDPLSQSLWFTVAPDGTYTESVGLAGGGTLQLAFGGFDGVLYGHNAGNGEFFTMDLDGTKTSIGSVGGPQFTDLASGASCDVRYETAWGDGTRFVPRGNWATYFTHQTTSTPTTT
jgi:hypothetical protein